MHAASLATYLSLSLWETVEVQAQVPDWSEYAQYLPLLFAGIGVALFGWVAWRRRQRQKLLAYLDATWGKPDERERDHAMLADQYQLCRTHAEQDALDDDSWLDLNMDEVFDILDRTHTSAGEAMLHVMLRSVVNDPAIVKQRGCAIRQLLNDRPLRTALRLRLHQAGRGPHINWMKLLWGGQARETENAWLYNLLAGVAVVSLLSIFVLGLPALVIVVLPVYLINMSLTSILTGKDLLLQLRSLRYIGTLIAVGRQLEQIECQELTPWTHELKRATTATKSIARRINALSPERNISTELMDQVAQYISAFFLSEIRTYNRVMRDVIRYQDDLQTIVRRVGELDALQSVASFRSSRPDCCDPEFTTGARHLEICDVWHPLLESPVTNSVSCTNKNLFITGSNMAGKSTFLRAVSLNVVFAQTFHTCFALSYRATQFRFTSSISHLDEIGSGTSYFMAEAQRLLHVVQSAQIDNPPFLCVIDELLRGTNSLERHAASLAILELLARSPAVIIVASHDTELGDPLRANYHLYHFAESFENDEMTFDYRVKPGLCRAGNALRTLDYIGFPKGFVIDAQAHLQHILKCGGIYSSQKSEPSMRLLPESHDPGRR